uniref:ribosomal protein S4 n=1 Tax=Schizaea fistulosa TaxID=292911 RepID=UPI002114E712|nr:ribosomal protein S4 [Schizaea fistulosa]UTJ90250.1 ribosomal protein S4 [Schizaea fistulosa]
MSRYRGPRLKIIRRSKNLPGLTGKMISLQKARLDTDQSFSGKMSQFCVRLESKQRLRFNHGSTECQLPRYVRVARKAKGSTGQVPLQLLEMRLDNIIFQSGMASTIPAARQLVNHRHVLVNGCVTDIPSYPCKPKDVITIRSESIHSCGLEGRIGSTRNKKVPNHLACWVLDGDSPRGLVNGVASRESVNLDINELLVVEYHSRKA